MVLCSFGTNPVWSEFEAKKAAGFWLCLLCQLYFGVFLQAPKGSQGEATDHRPMAADKLHALEHSWNMGNRHEPKRYHKMSPVMCWKQYIIVYLQSWVWFPRLCLVYTAWFYRLIDIVSCFADSFWSVHTRYIHTLLDVCRSRFISIPHLAWRSMLILTATSPDWWLLIIHVFKIFISIINTIILMKTEDW